MPNAGELPMDSGKNKLPGGVDATTALMLLFGFCALYLPSYWLLSKVVWPTDEQGHGPIILLVSIWLLYQKREALAAIDPQPSTVLGSVLLVLSLCIYIFGRSQSILLLEVGSQIITLIALFLMFLGKAALRTVWFPLFFLLFMVPLPEALVSSVTAPLKAAVSTVAGALLFEAGLPVGRAGVMLTVGQYQLLVADACAGLNSMFTLEALGLLYMNLMNYKSPVRNVILAILLIPISFCANIIRVMILVIVTYKFGDEAGQGFVHGFAGMVLFMVALVLMLIVDRFLGLFFNKKNEKEVLP